MPDQDYSHRDVLDKLGIRPGDTVAVDESSWKLDAGLKARVVARSGAFAGAEDDAIDVVLATADGETDAVELLARWKARIGPAGGIWLLTPKRGRPGYVDQTALIPAGAAAGVVDNKVCSVSDTVSAMRFVIRRKDRACPEAGRDRRGIGTAAG